MKLHLPKALLVAVLAACFSAQSTFAGWASDNQCGGYIYYYDEADTAVSTVETFTLPTADNGVTDVGSQADKFEKIYMVSGFGGESQSADYAGQTTSIGKVVAADGVAFSIVTNPWQGWKYYNALTIDELEYGEGSGSGILNVANAKDNVVVKNLSGKLTSTTVSGNLTIGTEANATAAYTIEAVTVNGGGTLTLAGGTTTLGKAGANQTVKSDGEIIVGTGATMKFAKTDTTHWSNKTNISLLGGTWDAVGTRQTLAGNSTLKLVNGTVTDSNGGFGDSYGVVDFVGENSIESSGTSSITGGVRLRNGNVTVTVSDGTLTVDTFMNHSGMNGGIIKKGTGTLKLTKLTTSGNNIVLNGNTVINAGTVEYAVDGEVSYSKTVSGAGNIAMSGSGKMTLANVSDFTGDISVTNGTLDITALSATETIGTSVADGATLSIGAVSVDVSSWTPTSAASKYYVYETVGEGEDATTVAVESTTGNGFYADESTYLLFDGYEWSGSVDGYTTSAQDGDTYLTANGDITTVYHVVNGTVNMADVGLTPTDTFTGYDVYSGATLDYAGSNPERLTVNLRGGATLANTGTGKGDNLQQLKELTLTGDATVNAAQDMGLVGHSYDKTTLDLAGNKLTKTGNSSLLLINTEISAGSIDIQKGTVKMYNQDSGGLSVDDSVAVNIAQGANLNIVGNKEAIIDGDFILNSTGTGTINLNRDVNIGSEGGTSTFAGTISVNSNKLYLGNSGSGDSEMEQIDLSGATIALNGGTEIRYFGGNSTVGTLHVKQNGLLYVHATNKSSSNQGTLTINKVNVDAEKTLSVGGYWESNVKIGVLTGEGSFNQTHNTMSYTIDTVEAGFGSITNAGTMTLGTASTTVNLGSTVTNTGTVTMLGSLVLSGEAYADFTVSDTKYDNTGDGVADDGATDGYLKDVGATSFTIVNGGTINKDGITSVTYNGESVSTDSLSIADNKLTLSTQVAITPTMDYYVNTTVDYAADSVVASDDTTGIILNGGTLNLNTALNTAATNGIVAAENSTINIASGVTLDNSSVSSNGGTATIAGDSTAKYSMGVADMKGGRNAANNATKLNVALGADWKGTVVFEEGSAIEYFDFDLNDFGQAGSTIQFNGTSSGTYLGSTGATYTANIDLQGGGLTLGNGFGGTAYTFAGDFTGNGNLVCSKNLAKIDDNGVSRGLLLTFTGDMSGWTGDLRHTNTNSNNSYTYAAADGKNTAIGNKFTATGGTMNVTVDNASAVEMKGDVTADGGVVNLIKTGGSKLTVNNLSAKGSNVVLTGTGDNAIEVGTMSIASGKTVTGEADVTVTKTLSVSSSNAISLDGTLVLTGATVDLSGFTVDTTTAQDTYVYTLGTAAGGINPDDPGASISYTRLNVDGYTAELAAAAADPTTSTVMLLDGAATNNYLVLTLTKVDDPDTLTSLNVTGATSYADGVLTLTTDVTDAAAAVFGDKLAASMTDEVWDAIVGTYDLEDQIGVSFADANGNLLDFNGANDAGTAPIVTINGEGTTGAQVLTGDGTVVGNYTTAYIPEPTTTTLSLLALAALAVRRRRK